MDLISTLVVMVVLSVGVCELRNLYAATTCLLIQGIFSVLVFHYELEIQSLFLSFISLIVVIPLIIYLTIKKTKSFSEKPFIDGLTSISILFFLVGVFTVYMVINFANTNPVMLTVISLFVIGIYTMLAKADLIKLGLGLALLNNATHILMLEVELPVIVEISLTTVKVITIALVMSITLLSYKKTKSLDVRKLMLLRW
ncbi:MAG: hypothetical protein N3E48_04095 [Candidatus Bathyarchaeota archaeon]|nr:hypothetical protein [Candidatus Bathyarchaeota archaeon]